MTTLLYQFPLSHYCEKARWALDYKKIPYQVVNLLPGPHLLVTKKLAGKTTVPILSDRGQVIQESSAILTYLDQHYPENQITPRNEKERQEALRLEQYYDDEIGLHLRRIFYYYVLPDTSLAKSILLNGAPFYGRALYALIFPVLRKKMQELMRIDDEGLRLSMQHFQKAMDKLEQEIKGRKFLVGNEFSRADLTVAALLSPLYSPEKHPFPWSQYTFPPLLTDFVHAYEQSPVGKWLKELYVRYR